MYFTLTYVSKELELLSPAVLAQIARTSARENALVGVTGVLLHAEGHFLQRIEGPKEEVLQLYDRIARDPRHRMLVVTDLRDVSTRVFDGWGMALVDARGLGGDAEADWRTLLDDLCRDPSQADGLALRLRSLIA